MRYSAVCTKPLRSRTPVQGSPPISKVAKSPINSAGDNLDRFEHIPTRGFAGADAAAQRAARLAQKMDPPRRRGRVVLGYTRERRPENGKTASE